MRRGLSATRRERRGDRRIRTDVPGGVRRDQPRELRYVQSARGELERWSGRVPDGLTDPPVARLVAAGLVRRRNVALGERCSGRRIGLHVALGQPERSPPQSLRLGTGARRLVPLAARAIGSRRGQRGRPRGDERRDRPAGWFGVTGGKRLSQLCDALDQPCSQEVRYEGRFFPIARLVSIAPKLQQTEASMQDEESPQMDEDAETSQDEVEGHFKRPGSPEDPGMAQRDDQDDDEVQGHFKRPG